MLSRLKFILDRELTVANALEKSIARYGADFEVMRFSGSLQRFGVHGQSLTLAQLKTLCDRLSQALAAHGLQRYDRVAIYQRGSVEYLIYSLAIMRAGAITVPINGSMRTEDLRHYLDYTGARFAFIDSERLDRLDPAVLAEGRCLAIVTDGDALPGPGMLRLQDALPPKADRFEPVDIHLHDDVMIVHTSGTTGFPKGVLHGSYSIARATKGQLLIQPLTRANRILLASPANHHITQASIISCFAAGIPCYVPAGESPEELLQLIERERCTLVLSFPDIYQGMCEAGLDRFDLSRVKAWMAGGDSSHEVHIRQFTAQGAMLRLFGKPLIRSMYLEFFGTSEVGFAALLKVNFSFTRKFDRYVGKPTLVSPKVKVADEQGRPLPAGVPGRLMVKGPTLFKGYWNGHDRLHGVYIDGWWWTGDVAMKTHGGGYYHLDREVDSIRAGERRVYSLQLEERILKHPAVADVAVVELPNGTQTTGAGAVIEFRPGQAVETDAFHAWLQQQVPDYASLRVEILPPGEFLPRGLTGKVLKRRVRERYAEA
jgi:long-chain acyl-CoA synthetase